MLCYEGAIGLPVAVSSIIEVKLLNLPLAGASIRPFVSFSHVLLPVTFASILERRLVSGVSKRASL